MGSCRTVRFAESRWVESRTAPESNGSETKLSPPQLARIWGVSPDTVLAWIHAGELRAVNMARKTTGRPRFRIGWDDIREFERRRESTLTEAENAGRKRSAGQGDVIEFF